MEDYFPDRSANGAPNFIHDRGIEWEAEIQCYERNVARAIGQNKYASLERIERARRMAHTVTGHRESGGRVQIRLPNAGAKFGCAQNHACNQDEQASH
jgi:hypothetical protein